MVQKRRHSVAVKIGSVTIGGSNPIVVQSMTNTDTANVETTVQQTQQLAAAGSELVRITVNTIEAAAAVAKIIWNETKRDDFFVLPNISTAPNRSFLDR